MNKIMGRQSFAHLAGAEAFATVLVPPARPSGNSMISHARSFGKETEVTLCLSPRMGGVGINVGGFRSTHGSQGNGGASSDTRGREPLGDTSRVEDLAYD